MAPAKRDSKNDDSTAQHLRSPAASAKLSPMPRIAVIVAFLAAGRSPAAHCLATARGAKATASCHAEATSKPAKAPMSNCAAMVFCQTVLRPAAMVAPSPESVPAPPSTSRP